MYLLLDDTGTGLSFDNLTVWRGMLFNLGFSEYFRSSLSSMSSTMIDCLDLAGSTLVDLTSDELSLSCSQFVRFQVKIGLVLALPSPLKRAGTLCLPATKISSVAKSSAILWCLINGVPKIASYLSRFAIS